MTTAADVLALARTQLGYVEGPGSNVNKFSYYWKRPPQPWCADFVCWVLQKSGALDVPQSSYTPALYGNYQSANRSGHTPRVGSLVFFQWPDMGRIAHVGIVEEIRADGSLVTIEGNTDVAGGRTGGQVMRKVRRANIAGYGHPIYAPAVPPRPTGGLNPYYHRVLARGMSGSDVRAFKHALKVPIEAGAAGLMWNGALEVALRRFQHDVLKVVPNNRIAAREARVLK